MKNFIPFVLFSIACIALTSQAIAATPQQICQARKNRAVARFTTCSFLVESKPSKLFSSRSCQSNFKKRWKRIIRSTDRKNATCFDAPINHKVYKSYIRSRIENITNLLGKDIKNLEPAQRKCRARKTVESGKYAACRHRAEKNLARRGDSTEYNQLIGQCEANLQSNWQKIIDKATKRGATCVDSSYTVTDYKLLLDAQTQKVARVLAGTDLFNPIKISLNGSPLSLDAGGETGSLTITNTSAKGIASEINADFSNTALEGNVTVTANTCSSLAAGESCTLTLQTENTAVPMSSFIIKGTNTTEVSAVLTITAPPAVITLTGSPLQLTAGGGSGVISIINSSTISAASNITADFSGTALAGKLTETANTCSSVAPGTGCTITFTPGNVAVGQTDFSVQGDNTNALNAAISIITPAPTTATLSVAGSPLQLEVNGPTDILTITNTSLSVTALNITSNFTGTALDGNVTETGNTCSSLPPSASCTLIYTPGNTVVPPTSFTIEGTNTTTETGSIEIESGSTLSAVNASSGSASGGTGVTISGTGLTGTTAITFGGVAATSVNVINSTTITAVTPAHAVGAVDVVISTPAGGATLTNGYTYIITTVGQATDGGIIACLNGGLQNLIAATADNSVGIVWGTLGLNTGATSNTDGATNNIAIVVAEGAGTYGAQLCSDFEVDSQGNTPCQAGNTCYSDWFLPAKDQLDCNYTNQVAIGGFANAAYWSSTENNANSAWAQDFSNGGQGIFLKNNSFRVRCMRAFVP
jgi:hypothetical protein